MALKTCSEAGAHLQVFPSIDMDGVGFLLVDEKHLGAKLGFVMIVIDDLGNPTPVLWSSRSKVPSSKKFVRQLCIASVCKLDRELYFSSINIVMGCKIS